ncbi:TM1802 family CRISPR-associated protein [Pontibacter sp. G13]|uniref:TM1802 family CRISPR-associated protein n=1 Tax=Pontibacter sp. G13 TaxID=3074898 RepID=UPI00288A939C|nr:TM1802 family CRISPR-associated protein [Pontibacter sp. G13]WNJ18158.1 TM1802 family CRISPR-associated protein [Pontibacter sp. G13]
MMETLYEIGRQLSEDRDPWEDILEEIPEKLLTDQARQLNLVFDLETGMVEPEFVRLDNSLAHRKRIGLIKVGLLRGKSKKKYVSVLASKFDTLLKTLWGIGTKSGEPELIALIEKKYPQLQETTLFERLETIKGQVGQINEWFKTPKGNYNLTQISKKVDGAENLKIHLVSVYIQDSTTDNRPIPLFSDPDLFDLIEQEFSAFIEKPISQEGGSPKLDYLTGQYAIECQAPSYGNRDIQKIFGTTHIHTAPNISGKRYHEHFQCSKETEKFIDRGGTYLQKHASLFIAGLPHIAIPEIPSFSSTPLSLELVEDYRLHSEWIFSLKTLDEYLAELSEESVQGFRMNYVGIKSDGKSTKVINQIKDVPASRINQILRSNQQITQALNALGMKGPFSLGTFYFHFPIRKNGKKDTAIKIDRQTPCLQLFKNVLEARKIHLPTLYSAFCEYAQCVRYPDTRPGGYVNIHLKGEAFFQYQRAVFQYLGFIELVRKLELIPSSIQLSKNTMQYDPSIQEYFERLAFSESQQGLFFLGKVIGRISYEQNRKNNKRRVLEKIDYNGMNQRAIQRLATDVFQKAVQYGVSEKVTYDWTKFQQLFNAAEWKMDPKESVFYLLAGYTYPISSIKKTEQPQQDEQ